MSSARVIYGVWSKYLLNDCPRQERLFEGDGAETAADAYAAALGRANGEGAWNGYWSFTVREHALHDAAVRA